MALVILPAPADPQSSEGFYSINNQFQNSGPKGYTEFKILENSDLFWRIDLPGVPKDRLMVSIHPSKKYVTIEAFAPSLDIRYSKPRTYSVALRHFCDCCKMSRLNSDFSDGVLRLVISKTPKIPGASCPDIFPNRSDPNDRMLTGLELRPHPNVKEGPTMAYESTPLVTGGLFVRVDMPGVPKDNFTVSVTNGRVRVSGQAPALSHDSAGRSYSGDVAVLSPPVDLPSRWINTRANYGVIRLCIYTPV